MAKWITKRNVTILNFALLGVFVVALIAVAVPFVKKEPTPTPFSTEERPIPRMTTTPKQEDTYVCSKHREITSSTPGKCSQCGAELEKVERFAAIVDRDLFDAHLIVQKLVVTPPPPPLQWELAGVTKVHGEFVAIIRDKPKRTEYTVREGEEVPGYFGVTVTSISPELVKIYRAAVGEEELKMGESAAPGPGPFKDQWSEIIRPVSVGHTYVVKLAELEQRIGSPEAYVGTLGLEPNMDGSRVDGLRIQLLPRENFLTAAGLLQGDIIKTINGAPVTDVGSAVNLLRTHGKEFNIQLGIVRGRTARTLFYTLVKKQESVNK